MRCESATDGMRDLGFPNGGGLTRLRANVALTLDTSSVNVSTSTSTPRANVDLIVFLVAMGRKVVEEKAENFVNLREREWLF